MYVQRVNWKGDGSDPDGSAMSFTSGCDMNKVDGIPNHYLTMLADCWNMKCLEYMFTLNLVST